MRINAKEMKKTLMVAPVCVVTPFATAKASKEED